jgi:two-component system chemotaxis response regulator CheB
MFIVDDSAVTRKVLREALASDPLMEVIGIAADGETALKRNRRMQTGYRDIGRGTSGQDRIGGVKTHSQPLGAAACDYVQHADGEGGNNDTGAQSLGASDYVAKPSNSGSVENTKTKISVELIPRIKALCTRSQTIQGVAPARVAAYSNKVSGTVSDAHSTRHGQTADRRTNECCNGICGSEHAKKRPGSCDPGAFLFC